VFHGPGDLRAEELPWPEPGPGEIVVRIEAALTCGTDVKTLRRGHPVMIPRVPTVFGHELAGTVSAVGAGVRDLREGDRVVAANSAPCGRCRPCVGGRPNLCEDLLFVNGAYGQAIALPPRLVARNVVRLGASLPAAHAAFAEPLACALLAVERGRVEDGQTVVIFGHGPLGCLLAMVAAARKARVIIVGKAGYRLDRVAALGIGECVDATATDDVLAASNAQKALSPDMPRVAWLRTQLQNLEARRTERLMKVGQLTLIATIFITFVLQNAQPVNVHFLLFSLNIRLIWVIFGCGLLGGVAGYLIGRPDKSLRALLPQKEKPARARKTARAS